MSGRPETRTRASERLLESERMALAAAAGSLVPLPTKAGTSAAAEAWVKALVTVSFFAFAYCCLWQARIISYRNLWLAGQRFHDGPDGQVGLALAKSLGAGERFTDVGLAGMIRRSTRHFSLAYWVGGLAGTGALMGAIWA